MSQNPTPIHFHFSVRNRQYLPYFRIGLLYMCFFSMLQLSTLAYATNKHSEFGPAETKKLFSTSCALCHGENGDGKGPAAKAMGSQAKPRDFTKGEFKYGSSKEQLFQTITKGVTGTAMPSWKHLPEAQRRALVTLVQSFKKK